MLGEEVDVIGLKGDAEEAQGVNLHKRRGGIRQKSCKTWHVCDILWKEHRGQ